MSNIIQSAQTENKIIKISVDEFPSDPYNDWCQLSHIVAWHNHYILGKKSDHEQFKKQENFAEFVKEQHGKIVLLNLYMYDHSGISLSTSRTYPFNDRWDACQVGYAYVTYEEIRNEYNVKHVTKKLIEKTINLINAEIETYNQYLNGSVYAFTVYNVEKCNKGHTHQEIADSLSDIYGDLNDVKEAIRENTGLDTSKLNWINGDIREN